MLSFFVYVHLPPRSTLFPYTTLFRSQTGRARYERGRERCSGERRRVFRGRPCAGRRRHAWSASRRDRKSTRLNSSHLVNSYAVFCLKKKKNSYIIRMIMEQLETLIQV